MKPMPITPATIEVSKRVVWFKEPEEALSDPIHFLAHVMTYGTLVDLAALEGIVGKAEYREALGSRSARYIRSADVGVLESDLRSRSRHPHADTRRFISVRLTYDPAIRVGNRRCPYKRKNDPMTS
jgi:hypothetical protein